MPDADEGWRQYVEREQVEEIRGTHGHRLVTAAMFVVLVVVGDLALLGVIAGDARVADGHSVGISSDVLQHLIHSLGRRAAIDHPRFLEAPLADILRHSFSEFFQTGCQHRHELGTEHGAECLHREQEITSRSTASLQVMPHAVLADASACHYAVDMRMIVQVAAPGMQDGGHASL